jgi:hypothetical protein
MTISIVPSASRIVLAREQRGRRDHRDLLSGHRRDEGGAQRDLGLAETDVAADEAVHRLAFGEVLQHVLDRPVLVVGLLPGEAVDELVEGRLFGQQHRRLAQGAPGCGLEQLVRDLADALLEPGLAPLPGLAAELVERDALGLAAVAREDVDVLDRDIELVAAGVGQHHAVVRALAYGDRLQPLVAADTVVHVDDEIAGRECRQLGQEGVGVLPAFLAADEPVAEDILFRDDFELGIGEAGLERQHQRGGNRARSDAECFLPGVGEGWRGLLRFAEDCGEARAAALGVGGDDRLPAAARDGLEMPCRCLVNVVTARAFGCEVAAAGETEVDGLGAFGLGEDVGAVDGPADELRVEFVVRQVESVGFQRAVAARCLAGGVGARFVVVGDVGQAFFGGALGRTVDDDQVFAREVVEQRDQPVLEQWQPVLHAGEAAAVADCLVERVRCGVGAEQFTVAAAEALDAVLVE